MKLFRLFILVVLAGGITSGQPIVRPADAPANVQLAAKEIRRYVYLRTGRLLPIAESGNGIALRIDPALGAQEYRIASNEISGGSDVGVLYGAYRYAELLGVRFYLHGDVVPDQRLNAMPVVKDEVGKPIFETRGILPFHDFLEGPDWWNEDDYKAYLSQMAKMRMNFMGFHCYPRIGLPWDGQEPLVWTGVAGDFEPDGRVKLSYPTSWASTQRRTWANEPATTETFSAGAAQLFETSAYGGDVMRGLMPAPRTPLESNEMFNRAGGLMNQVFTYGHRLGIQSWVGIELPLWIPDELRTQLKAHQKNPDSLAVRKEIFGGIFRRVKAAYPADGFWFWTGERPDEAAKVNEELLAAHEVMQTLPTPLRLGVCGWGNLAAHFGQLDATLPKDTVLGCINHHLGFAPVAAEFAGLGERPRFAIPWLEDDTAMTVPQLFAGRVRKDAADAQRYGCTGLLGIHWRTKVTSPNISMLAQSGWTAVTQAGPLADCIGNEGVITPSVHRQRCLPVGDFYQDWCQAQFGPTVAHQAAQIFSRMDGRLPRPACWALGGNYTFAAGPGTVGDADPRPWEAVAKEYAFVDEFAALQPIVTGRGNLERFHYWLGQFQYLKAMAELRCARSEFDQATVQAEAAPATIEKALNARRNLVAKWCAMMTHLLETVSTPGELGTVANLELHTRRAAGYLTNFDARLEKLLGHALPADCEIPGTYTGRPRLIVPTVRDGVTDGERLTLKMIALAETPVNDVIIHLRALGHGDWQTLPATHVARAVFTAQLPAARDDFEYYITAGDGLVWPATAPAMNQTVIVTP